VLVYAARKSKMVSTGGGTWLKKSCKFVLCYLL
jgi:hypothetical protein